MRRFHYHLNDLVPGAKQGRLLQTQWASWVESQRGARQVVGSAGVASWNSRGDMLHVWLSRINAAGCDCGHISPLFSDSNWVCCCTHASGWMEEMVEELFRVIWQLKSFKREIGGFCFLELKKKTSIYANCVHTVDTCAPSHTLSLSWAQPGSH